MLLLLVAAWFEKVICVGEKVGQMFASAVTPLLGRLVFAVFFGLAKIRLLVFTSAATV